jgi:hypothetical protein
LTTKMRPKPVLKAGAVIELNPVEKAIELPE